MKIYPTYSFPLDHIIARQHGGKTDLSNLAYACLHCNSHKGPNISGIDPKTGKMTRLYHPRRHSWASHFRIKGPLLIGRTAIGRTTVTVLDLNNHELVDARASLIQEGFVFE